MPLIFGAGKRYVPLKSGRSLQRLCPNCEETTHFQESQAQEYLSFFFIPLVKENSPSNPKFPYFTCSNCESTFAFATTRFTDAQGFSASFLSYLNQLFDWIYEFKARQKEKAQKRQKGQSIERDLKRIKREVRKKKEAGDRPPF